jgi:hypothetical protein
MAILSSEFAQLMKAASDERQARERIKADKEMQSERSALARYLQSDQQSFTAEQARKLHGEMTPDKIETLVPASQEPIYSQEMPADAPGIAQVSDMQTGVRDIPAVTKVIPGQYKPGLTVLGEETKAKLANYLAMEKSKQEHNLSEQAAKSRMDYLVQLAKKNPGLAASLGKDAASIKTPEPATYGALGRDLTPAEKSAETNFGKTYQEYEAAGGKAQFDKSFSKLEEVEQELAANIKAGNQKGVLGKLSGLLPQSGLDIANPQEAARVEKVRSAIQSTLKQALGTQFTAKEADQMMSRAYNPRQSDAQNLQTLKAEMEALRQKKAAIESYGEKYRKTGYATVDVGGKKDPNQQKSKQPSKSFDPDAFLGK